MTLLSNVRVYQPAPQHILSSGRFSPLHEIMQITANSPTFAGFSWGTINLARYMPLCIPVRFTVARFLSANNNNTGNTDVGLYSVSGTRLISTGTTARSGTNAVQYIGVTDQSFPPGDYYLAMVCSSATSAVMRTQLANTTQTRLAGMLQEQLASTVLPTTMTPVTSTSNGDYPVWGFTQSDTL